MALGRLGWQSVARGLCEAGARNYSAPPVEEESNTGTNYHVHTLETRDM